MEELMFFDAGTLPRKLSAVQKKRAATSLLKISPVIARTGSNPSPPIIAATTYTNCRRRPRGFATLEMLKLLEDFDLKTMDPNGADALHLMIETKKLAFADRDSYLADRDFMKVQVQDLFSPARV